MKPFITKSLFLLVVTMLIASVTGFAAFAVGGAVGAASLFPKPKGVAMMALDVEIWKPWILDSLFKDNQFLNFARNADEHVLQGKVVHIPNAGSASGVERNRSSLPASVTQRTDVDVTYSLDEFTTDPRLIVDADKILSYDKMASAMGQDMGAIKQLVADWIIYHWAPAATAQIVRTTGSAVVAHLPSATGNRKYFVTADLRAAKKVLDKQNIPATDRYALISAEMYDQLLVAMSDSTYRDFSRYADGTTGVIGMLYGFKLLMRADTVVYTNATPPVKKLPGAAGAATNNDAVLCWHKDYLERAIGTVNIFEQLKDPTYYGDIYSMLLRAGGRAVENESKGVVAIVQAATS
jgi:hypothetical protein